MGNQTNALLISYKRNNLSGLVPQNKGCPLYKTKLMKRGTGAIHQLLNSVNKASRINNLSYQSKKHSNPTL